MKLYAKTESYTLYNDSMLNLLEDIQENSIDSIVCDPPYELGFMNKAWDSTGIAFQKETWEKCFKVLKSGGYLLAFGGSRTYHRIACAIEDAGFEIRDTIMWLYGSGFPKSLNIGKAVESKLTLGSANTQDFKNLKGEKVKSGGWGIAKECYEQGARQRNYDEDEHLRTTKVDYETEQGKQWNGWGTCLKPAFEPVIVARKPCENSTTDNVLKYGVGGINIDECRVAPTNEDIVRNNKCGPYSSDRTFSKSKTKGQDARGSYGGRFPANVILTYDENDFDEVCGGFPNTKSTYNEDGQHEENIHRANQDFLTYGYAKRFDNGFNDSGSAARYFYCAKASKRDRDEGLESFDESMYKQLSCSNKQYKDMDGVTKKFCSLKRNMHPTVKPCDLMQYLVRLVTTKGATILDPFNGSGSTGKAVMYENNERNANYKYIGIELSEEYCAVAKARIEYAINDKTKANEKPKKEVKKKEAKKNENTQISFFDLI